jgi:hypothetical protein
MSLIISTPITTQQGFEVASSYARVAVLNAFKGQEVEALAELYASEAAFKAGKLPITADGLILSAKTVYDYESGEKTILDLAHDILIEAFKQQGVTATKSL